MFIRCLFITFNDPILDKQIDTDMFKVHVFWSDYQYMNLKHARFLALVAMFQCFTLSHLCLQQSVFHVSHKQSVTNLMVSTCFITGIVKSVKFN